MWHRSCESFSLMKFTTDTHDMESIPHGNMAAVNRSLRLYAVIGAVLFLGTIITYCVATVEWLDVGQRGFDKWDAILGLGIASFKATLVAAVYMHLNHERRLVYWVMALAAAHAVGCFIGTWMHFADPIHDRFFYDPNDGAQQSLTLPQQGSERMISLPGVQPGLGKPTP
jgi:cytochrome c oxidase subunit IV